MPQTPLEWLTDLPRLGTALLATGSEATTTAHHILGLFQQRMHTVAGGQNDFEPDAELGQQFVEPHVGDQRARLIGGDSRQSRTNAHRRPPARVGVAAVGYFSAG
jgi:hypothetical protein